jgi:hypothetical protein
MTKGRPRTPEGDHKRAVPHYELRATQHRVSDSELEIWQVPSPASPHLKTPVRVAGLRGRNLGLVEHKVLRRLQQARIDLGGMRTGDARKFSLDEDMALTLGLLFRVLAPMRDRDNMRACTEGIEGMGREEAAYWLGMAMHRKYPRRVLTALRFLLTEPKR